MNVDHEIDRYNAAVAYRARSQSILYDAGKYAWPNAREMYKHISTSEGQEFAIDIYDSTAIDAAFKLTSNIFGYLMPVGTKWFEFQPDSFEDKENPQIQKWVSIASDVTHSEIWKSNYIREMFMTIRSMVVFGTGVISVEKDGKDILYRSYHLADVFFEENSKGIIDTVFRRIYYTARQAVQEFGENLHKKILDAYKDPSRTSEKFEFFHVVHPNTDFNKDKIDSKKFVSKYIYKEEKQLVKKDSFDDQPYIVMRFSKSPDEIMGRSPVTESLPEIRMLNTMSREYIQSVQLANRPPMVAEDDGLVGPPVTEPGGMIYIRSGSRPPVPWQTGIDIQKLSATIEEQRSLIRSLLLLDAFQTLGGLKNISSATESQIRKQEGQVIVAPVTSGVQKDALDPLIIRTLNLIDKKKLEKAPKDFEFSVNYIGRLALAMSALQADAIEIWLAKMQPYAELGVYDNIKMDEASRMIALSTAVPAQLLEDVNVRDAKRAEIKASQDQERAVQNAETGSKAIKNVAGIEGIGDMI